MPRDYAIVKPRFWTGDTGRRMRGHFEAQVVAAYLMTGPSANMIGLYYLPIPTLAHETGLTADGAWKALRWLSEEGFAHYDRDQEVVWVPEMGRHQVGEELKASDKRIAGAVREALPYRKCRFYQEFVSRYREPWRLPSMPAGEAELRPYGAPPKPLRSQDQDQDQDQEQEQEALSPAAREGEREPAPEVGVPSPEAAPSPAVEAVGPGTALPEAPAEAPTHDPAPPPAGHSAEGGPSGAAGEQAQPPRPPPAPVTLSELAAERAKTFPALAALLRAAEAEGIVLTWPKDPKQMNESAVLVGPERAIEIVRREHAKDPSPFSGWYAQALYRAAHQERRRARGDLGVEHGGEWWRALSREQQEAFLEARRALDPDLDEAAPFPALGVASPAEVEQLIARTIQAHQAARAVAEGAV